MSQLIEQLISEGALKTKGIISAFRKIKREDFMLPETLAEAEENHPVPIGFGQTISQPFTVAFMLELLQPKEGDKILDIGSGSGWTTALLAEIVGPKGKVYAIERIPELKKFGENNVRKYFSIMPEGEVGLSCYSKDKSLPTEVPPKLCEGGTKAGVQFLCSDGTKGLLSAAPFDRILISAAARQIPQKLPGQLKIGGRLVLPVGKSSQDIVAVDKISEKEYKEKRYPGFIFVPLVTSH